MTLKTELATILDFLRYAASQFQAHHVYFGHGTDNAWDEAITLIFHALHLPATLYPTVLNAKLTAQEKKTVLTYIDKRVQQRLPVAYITNEAWFADLAFYVDERVLIPRSPIAELIQQHFAPWIAVEQVNHILDLCTGSGCIAIACAKAFPNAHIVASDISHDALAVAAINVERHQVEAQVQLLAADLFTHIPQTPQFDIIVSNPPYVSQAEMATLYTEYQHEPALGLAAGEDGLAIVHRILAQAANYLTANGILVVEVGNSEVALMEAYPHVPFTWLEFNCGGDGVFVLTAEDLRKYF